MAPRFPVRPARRNGNKGVFQNHAPARFYARQCVTAEELARRLGRERCWRVSWPSINDALRKDANEVLIHDGPEVLREVIDNAQPYPIKNLHDLGAF